MKFQKSHFFFKQHHFSKATPYELLDGTSEHWLSFYSCHFLSGAHDTPKHYSHPIHPNKKHHK
jgi:hypothetical protein